MTTVSMSGAGPIIPAPAVAAGCVVRWRVSRAAWPTPLQPGDHDPEISFCIEPLADTAATVSISAPGQPQFARVVATLRVDGDLLHVDAPGTLSATLRGSEPLYAATPLLASLAIPGGRYELVSPVRF